MLKKHIIKVVNVSLFIAFAIILSSCKEEDKITKPNNPISALGSLPFDADFVISTYVWDEYWYYYSDTLTDHRNYFQAVFSDGSQLVNIDSISNQFINLDNTHTGQYSSAFADVNVYPPSGVYTWDLINYLGSNATLTHTLVPRLTIISPLKTDTVSKSGFTITYNGSSSADEAEFLLYQADAANEEMGINISSDPKLLPIRLRFSDVGTINVGSSDLSSLIPNRYYQYDISHAKYDSTFHGGRTGILHSTASVSQYVFITN